MIKALPDFGKHHPDQVLEVQGSLPVGVYRRKGKHVTEREHAIGLVHGMLGAHTMSCIAGELAQQGHDVFTVHNDDWRMKQRAKSLHRSTKTAMAALGRETVEYIGHSDAVPAMVGHAKYQKDKDPQKLAYIIKRMTTVSGNGTNDDGVNLFELPLELESIVKLARYSPHQTVRAYGRSIMNAIESPVSTALQGFQALFCDERDSIAKLIENGVDVRLAFQEDDRVIPMPSDMSGHIRLPFGHMGFVIMPDAAIELAKAA